MIIIIIALFVLFHKLYYKCYHPLMCYSKGVSMWFDSIRNDLRLGNETMDSIRNDSIRKVLLHFIIIWFEWFDTT